MTTIVLVILTFIALAALILGIYMLYLGFQEYRDMKLSMQQQDRDKLTDSMIRRGMLYNEKHKLRLIK